MKTLKLSILVAFISLFAFQGCKKEDTVVPDNSKKAELSTKMHQLWANHMQWTYNTVFAFLQKQDALDAELTRLLKNQTQIGDAFKPYYGNAKGYSLG